MANPNPTDPVFVAPPSPRARQGKATLIAGTKKINTTAVMADSIIRLTRQGVGATGAAALGNLSVGAIVPQVSFVINAWSAGSATALQASDVSLIGWEIAS